MWTPPMLALVSDRGVEELHHHRCTRSSERGVRRVAVGSRHSERASRRPARREGPCRRAHRAGRPATRQDRKVGDGTRRIEAIARPGVLHERARRSRRLLRRAVLRETHRRRARAGTGRASREVRSCRTRPAARPRHRACGTPTSGLTTSLSLSAYITSASTASSAATSASTCPKVSLGRPVSTGFDSNVSGGSRRCRPFTVESASGGTETPRLRSTSVMSRPGPACAVTTPTPGSDDGRMRRTTSARIASTSCPTSSTSTAPACVSAAAGEREVADEPAGVRDRELADVGTADLQRHDWLALGRRTIASNSARPSSTPSRWRPITFVASSSTEEVEHLGESDVGGIAEADPEPQAQALTTREEAHGEVHPPAARDDRCRAGLESGHVRHEVRHHAVKAGFMNPEVLGPSIRMPCFRATASAASCRLPPFAASRRSRPRTRPRPRRHLCRSPRARRALPRPARRAPRGRRARRSPATERATARPSISAAVGVDEVERARESRAASAPSRCPPCRSSARADDRDRLRAQQRPQPAARHVSRLRARTTSAGCRGDGRDDARARSGRAAAGVRDRRGSHATPSGCGCRCRSRCRTR